MKRIIVLTTLGAVVAAMLVTSGLTVGGTQEAMGQEASVCAPWSKAWDVSGGDWYFQWYRWCYDPAYFDPAYESSWYTENGSWEYYDKANLCPGTGTCTVSTG